MKHNVPYYFRAKLIAALLAGISNVLLLQYPAFAANDSGQEQFIGLQPGLGTLPLLGQGRTRSISAENPTGEKGRGGMAIPNPTEPKPAASARAADDLGQGWKVRPFIRLNAHETAVLMDVGGPGPDRGLGGRYLIVPPGYDGPLPEGGFYVARPRTLRVLLFGRLFLQEGETGPAVESVRSFMKVYPYQAGGVGTSFASFLRGEARLGPVTPPPETVVHDLSGAVMDTVMPSDSSYYEWLDEVVQQEPTGSLDPELMGSIAAIGIVKGEPFAPDERMKRILTDAAAVGNATARSLFMRPRDPGWYFYPDSAWMPLTVTVDGHDFETLPPAIEGPVHDGVRTPTGVGLRPPTGYRHLDARTNFSYGVICLSPAECMLLSGIGSQYLMATVDVDQQPFDGAKTYRLTLPKDIPAKTFWSLTLYDNQTRSMLNTPQRYPRAGSQSYPSPAAEPSADGSTTVYFAPEQPDGVGRGNWIQTVPGKGWFVILRLYGPLESYFDRSWQLGEIEPVA